MEGFNQTSKLKFQDTGTLRINWSKEKRKKDGTTNPQTTQPPISNSGALTTLVKRIIIDLFILEASPEAEFLPGQCPSVQLAQHQSPSGRWSNFKQAATKTFNRINDEWTLHQKENRSQHKNNSIESIITTKM